MAKAPAPTGKVLKTAGKPPPAEVEDGRKSMHKLFVESKIITAGDFDLCWSTIDPTLPPGGVSGAVHPGVGGQRNSARGQVAESLVRQVAVRLPAAQELRY